MQSGLFIFLAINTVLLLIILMREFIKEKDQDRLGRLVREEITKNREELGKNLNVFTETFSKQLTVLTGMNENKFDKLRETVEVQLRNLQEDNNKKLEKIRETVDEKLQSTLEKRLGESFKLVSDRLEKVHQGLGEMQTLASGVGDLKKVLSNVKTRGILGEIQLGNLLEQILTPEQYEKNIITKSGSKDPVEFAIKFSGKEDQTVYLPIDSKFPTEDYQRLQEASETADAEAVKEAGKSLEQRLKLEAKKIRDKYIEPPKTTDFAILFLPMEGLYAEVLRRPGLFELLQRDYKITVAGPTTISAILNSFQMGFRTLAVEKRASEVWNLLGGVKAEFGKFGDILRKTSDKLKQASSTIEEAERKSRTIERKLKDVQGLPSVEEKILLEDDVLDLSKEETSGVDEAL
jgi:DNA recombination protein RmuC